ncbi:hypothetical protein V9P72_001076, partial [Yersinia enterocolitica]
MKKRNKLSSPRQKYIAQKIKFTKAIVNSNNLEQAIKTIFNLLVNSRKKLNAKDALYEYRAFLSLESANDIMRERYIVNDNEVLNVKGMEKINIEFSDEIDWVIETILFFSSEINIYVENKNTFLYSLLSSNFDAANTAINNVKDVTGVSLWTIVSELNVLFFNGDITNYKDKLKELNDVVHDISKTTIIYEGVRCNKLITADRYIFSLGKMIEELRLDGQSHYEEVIKYRHDFDPSYKYKYIDLIYSRTNEQRIVDSYNSLLKVISYKYNDGYDFSSCKSQLTRLKECINDREMHVLVDRIVNKSNPSELKKDNFDLKYDAIVDSYLHEKYKEVIFKAEEFLRKEPSFSALYLPYIKSLVREKKETSLNGVLGNIINLCCNIIKDQDFDNSISSLMKIYQVLGHNNWSHTLGCVIDSHNGSHSIDTPNKFNFVDNSMLRSNLFSFRKFDGGIINNIVDVPNWRKEKFSADKLFYQGDFNGALEIYTNSSDKLNEKYNLEVFSKIIYCQHEIGNYKEATSLLANKILSGANPRSLPINIVSKRIANDGRFKDNNNELFYEAVILNAYNKYVFSEYTQDVSNLCENFLENIGIIGLEDITFDNELIPRHLLVEVLNLDVLDGMTTIFSSEKEVLLTRLKLDRYIASNKNFFSVDEINRANQEINTIFYKIIVELCSFEAGEGKIYVDRGAIKNKLIEDIDKNIENLKLFEDKSMDMIVEHSDFENDLEYHSPANQFSSYLFEIILKIVNFYTIDKLHGIDQSLNVGIRHGGMVNLLWAPLKNNAIAATKSKDNKFIPNHIWRNDFGYYGKKTLDNMDKSLVIFNEKVSEIISEAKDKVHINTGEFVEKEKLFNYVLDIDYVVNVVSSIDDITADAFIDRIFSILDKQTDICMKDTRTRFIDELRNELQNEIDTLKESLSDDKVEIENLNKAISRSKIEINRSIDILQSWFSWSGVSKTPFDLKAAFEKSKIIVNQLHPWIDIKPLGYINSSMQLDGVYFTDTVAMLTLVLENTIKHSNFKEKIEVNYRIKESNQNICFYFSN